MIPDTSLARRRAPKRIFLFLFTCLLLAHSIQARADFGNYNSILFGSRAAGMGGAFTALSGDSAAVAFYNPAMLSRMVGTTFSASATVYNKYATSFADQGNLSDSTQKLNRGNFQAIPSSAGSANGFGHFAIGLSILNPDYDIFNGDVSVAQFPNSTSFLTLKDQSLWVGGNLAVNFTDELSAGVTIYYTSRDYQRSTTDLTAANSQSRVFYESKSFTSNNMVYLVGGAYKLNEYWNLGASWRLPSVQISGDGSYYASTLDTAVSGTPTTSSRRNIAAETKIPQRFAAGVSYEVPKKFTVSFDAQWYGSETYLDLRDSTAGDLITHKQTINYAIGSEFFLRHWLALRTGVYTNFSSHPDIDGGGVRRPDHIDMLGFSANLGIFSEKTTFTFGGYFTGGRGQSTQNINQQIVVVPKVQYVYTMLVSSSFQF